jgi:hypothetical protein
MTRLNTTQPIMLCVLWSGWWAETEDAHVDEHFEAVEEELNGARKFFGRFEC